MPKLRVQRKTLHQLGWVVLVWIAVFLLRLLPLGGDWAPVSDTTYVLLISWLALFAASWSVAATFWPKRSFGSSFWPEFASTDRRIINFSVAAGIGALLLVVEFALIRGYGFSTSVAEIRVFEVEAASGGRGGSALSGIGRLLMPALFVAWIVFRQSVGRVGSRTQWLLYAVTAFVLWAQSAFEGGRFFLFALILVIWFSGTHRRNQKVGNNARYVIAAGVAVLIFSSLVFIDRYSSSSPNFGDVYAGFIAGFNVKVDSHVYERLEGHFSALWFVVIMFWVYLTHAVGELDVLIGFPVLNHAYGGFQFPQIQQAMRIILGWQPEFDAFRDLPSPGVYLTALGALYIDFSYFGCYMAALVAGALIGVALEERNAKRVGRLATSAPLLLVVAVFLPVHSIITTVWPALMFAWVFCGDYRRECKQTRLSSP